MEEKAKKVDPDLLQKLMLHTTITTPVLDVCYTIPDILILKKKNTWNCVRASLHLFI